MENINIIKEIRSFNRFYTNIIGVIDRYILGSPLSLTEVRLLFEINHDPKSTARKIKNFLQIDEGYLSRSIDKLVKKGLIIRKKSENDARSYILSLSKEGEKEFMSLDERASKTIGSLIRFLSFDEKNDLVKTMDRIKELLTKE